MSSSRQGYFRLPCAAWVRGLDFGWRYSGACFAGVAARPATSRALRRTSRHQPRRCPRRLRATRLSCAYYPTPLRLPHLSKPATRTHRPSPSTTMAAVAPRRAFRTCPPRRPRRHQRPPRPHRRWLRLRLRVPSRPIGATSRTRRGSWRPCAPIFVPVTKTGCGKIEAWPAVFDWSSESAQTAT
jgi:hypothetical protein